MDGHANTLGDVGSFDSTTGVAGFFHYPMTRFGLSSVVPESGSLGLLVTGLLVPAAAFLSRRKSSR